jgi:YHS domain-containing protein
MQVTDPVCNMPIESTKAAATEVVQGQTYYFCSPSCHNKFHAAPERYAKTQGGVGKGHGSHRC